MYPSVSKLSRARGSDNPDIIPNIDEVLEEYPFDHSLSTFLATWGEEIMADGHPQTPGKRASTLCTPHVSAPR